MHIQRTTEMESTEDVVESKRRTCKLSPIEEEFSIEIPEFQIVKGNQQLASRSQVDADILDDVIVEDFEM